MLHFFSSFTHVEHASFISTLLFTWFLLWSFHGHEFYFYFSFPSLHAFTSFLSYMQLHWLSLMFTLLHKWGFTVYKLVDTWLYSLACSFVMPLNIIKHTKFLVQSSESQQRSLVLQRVYLRTFDLGLVTSKWCWLIDVVFFLWWGVCCSYSSFHYNRDSFFCCSFICSGFEFGNATKMCISWIACSFVTPSNILRYNQAYKVPSSEFRKPTEFSCITKSLSEDLSQCSEMKPSRFDVR